MTYAQEIAKKWYYELDFPHSMNKPFEEALKSIQISDGITIESYATNEQNGAKNLLYFLYFCEHLSQKYKEKGISNQILADTLHDLVIWTKTWSDMKGELYLGELAWLKRHLEMRLFKLGRLQFCMAPSEFDIPEKKIVRGAPIIEVHIPEGEPLSPNACCDSLNKASAFFDRYFPDFAYSLFTCHSWLLDTSLGEFLPENSNILRFSRLFQIVRQDPSDAILGYLFEWGAKRSDIQKYTPSSSFAAKVKEASVAGRPFYEGLGYIAKRADTAER